MKSARRSAVRHRDPLDDKLRLDRYLGSVRSITSARYLVDNQVRAYLAHPEQSADDFIQSLSRYDAGQRWLRKNRERQTRRRFNTYVAPIQELCEDTGHAKPFLVMMHDNRVGFSLPTFVKSAGVLSWLSNRCLLPLDHGRHWEAVGAVDESDRPYQEKDDKIVWRGNSSGPFSLKDRQDDYSSRYYIAKNWDKISKYDIGFSKIVKIDGKRSDIEIDRLAAMTKERLTMEQQLQSKYLLSLEGNDVASGLKWMLYSNSVVLMPHPRCESWYCEAFLEPFRHYVPVAHDLSDLDDVYAWCRDNDDTCEKIAMNGRAFVATLMDRRREQNLAGAVVDAYFSKVDLELEGDMKKVFD